MDRYVEQAEYNEEKETEENSLQAKSLLHKATSFVGRLTSLPPTTPAKTPIKTGEIFNPQQEVANILALPTAERRKAYEETHEKLRYQLIGIADTKEKVIQSIETNPNISSEEIMQIVREQGQRFGFPEEYYETAENIVNNLMKKHQKVGKVFEQCQNNPKAIYAHFFRRAPKGNVEAIRTPGGVYFRIHDNREYALAYSLPLDVLGVDKKETRQRWVDKAKRSGGAKLNYSFDKDLEGCISIENAMGRAFSGYSKTVFEHEKRHSLNDLFMDQMTSENVVNRIRKAKTNEEMEYSLKGYFRFIRTKEYDPRVADEIIAYCTDGEERSSEKLLGILKQEHAEGGLYDYVDEDIAKGKHPKEKLLKELGGKLAVFTMLKLQKPEFLEMTDQVMKEVFETEYENIIQNGIEDFRVALAAGYSETEAAAVFGRKPIREWHEVIKRLQTQEYAHFVGRESFNIRKHARIAIKTDTGYQTGIVTETSLDKCTVEYPQGNNKKTKKTKTKEIENLNYPFKSREEWTKLWISMGGNPRNIDLTTWDLESPEYIAATEAWRFFSNIETDSEVREKNRLVFKAIASNQINPGTNNK